MAIPGSIDDVQTQLAKVGYVAGRDLATVVFLALKLGRPLFLEGEAGVGKTEIAKALSRGARPSTSFACSATKGWTPPRRYTNGTMPAQMIEISTGRGRRADRDRREPWPPELFSAPSVPDTNARCWQAMEPPCRVARRFC